MLASIVIRTHNEARYLPAVLDAVRLQSLQANHHEVVIVDSGSTDDTLKIAHRQGCRIVHIPQQEFSFGRSLNIGCDAAQGSHLVFISGHCVPTDGKWLECLLEPLMSGNAQITYGRQQGGPETKFSEHMLFAKYFPPDNLAPATEFFCNNANAAVRRDVWARYRFDEALTGLEDMHFARQVVSHGGTVRYVPKASVFHYHHENWSRVRRRYEREAIALQKIMPEVHVHASDALRYFMAGVLGDWGKAIAQRKFLRHAWEIGCFRFCQYYGTWRGNHIHRQLSRKAKESYFYPK